MSRGLRFSIADRTLVACVVSIRPICGEDTLVGSGLSVSTEAVNRDSDSLLRFHRAAAKSLARSASVATRNPSSRN